jgi:acetyl-CoA carboxylase biotin carboxyl carrier protein
VPEYHEKITELAELMEEFRLGEAKIETDGLRIAFRRRPAPKMVTAESFETEDSSQASYLEAEAHVEPEVPKGMPITSPMNGIFYGSPSPSSPPFVKEGETISAGQVVGLIEAMKVFNEIPSTVSGTVLKLVAETGSMVMPGDVLLYIG